MYTYRASALLALLLAAVNAQTPPGGWTFSPLTNATLNLTFNGINNINPAGELIPRAGISIPLHACSL